MSQHASSAIPPTLPEDRVPTRTKILYGLGTANDMWGNWLYPGLANTVFTIGLGLPPTLVGNLLMVQRGLDAVTDPIVGWMSDNTRTRWGRRRPWILFGGIAAGLGLPLLFMFNPAWPQSWITTWIWVSALLYMGGAVTAYNMPYQSLGAELTPDYHERTRVMAYKAIIQKFTEIVFFTSIPFMTMEVFRIPDAIDPASGLAVPKYDTLLGVRYYTLIIGLGMIVIALLVFFGVKERYYGMLVKKEPAKTPLKAMLKDTLTNRPFRFLVLVNLANSLGGSMIGTLGFYTTVYYVCGGDLKAGGFWNMLMGFSYSGGAMLSVPVVTWLAGRVGKRSAALCTLASGVLVFLATWVLYHPRFPWLQPFASGSIAMITSALGVLTGSMMADVIDHSELFTHRRSEGSFSACYSWFSKLGVALGMGTSGYVLALTGFDAAKAIQSAESIFNMRFYLMAFPIVGLVLAFVLMMRFPLTAKVMGETRTLLEARRGKV
jgi:glycoside/pentoside/hexuronide:cation symporter, GPH family